MFKKGDRVHLHDGTLHTMQHDGLPPRAAKRGRKTDYNDDVRVRGFVRGAIVDGLTGEGEPGDWHENIITREGHQQVIRNFVQLAGSAPAQWFALGYHTEAQSSNFSTALQIASEWGTASNLNSNAAGSPRANVAANQAISNSSILTQSFAYSSTMCSTNITVNAIAQCSSSAYSTSGILSLATFGSSTKGNSQALNVSYSWSFGV